MYATSTLVIANTDKVRDAWLILKLAGSGNIHTPDRLQKDSAIGARMRESGL